jgi:hypothetical protein
LASRKSAASGIEFDRRTGYTCNSFDNYLGSEIDSLDGSGRNLFYYLVTITGNIEFDIIDYLFGDSLLLRIAEIRGNVPGGRTKSYTGEHFLVDGKTDSGQDGNNGKRNY